jgi:hypothetical protein
VKFALLLPVVFLAIVGCNKKDDSKSGSASQEEEKFIPANILNKPVARNLRPLTSAQMEDFLKLADNESAIVPSAAINSLESKTELIIALNSKQYNYYSDILSKCQRPKEIKQTIGSLGKVGEVEKISSSALINGANCPIDYSSSYQSSRKVILEEGNRAYKMVGNMQANDEITIFSSKYKNDLEINSMTSSLNGHYVVELINEKLVTYIYGNNDRTVKLNRNGIEGYSVKAIAEAKGLIRNSNNQINEVYVELNYQILSINVLVQVFVDRTTGRNEVYINGQKINKTTAFHEMSKRVGL